LIVAKWKYIFPNMSFYPMRYAFLFLLLPTFLSAQPLSPRAQAQIDKAFSHVAPGQPGYIVGVIKDGAFVYQKGYGLANLEYGIPNSAQTAFNIASLSKQFTAACVALLMQEGKVKMEDEIKQFVPEFPDYEHAVQIKHLIYMTSGLHEYYHQPRANGSDWSSMHYFDVDTAIAASLRQPKLKFEPGTKWEYSNVNYMLLTRVVESVSGMDFAEFARMRLFEPLGMANTRVNDDLFELIPNRAMGYNFRDEDNAGWMVEYGYLPKGREGFIQIHRNAAHYGGSGVYTTLEDFKKWLDNFETKAFGGQEFYDLMHKRMTFAHPKDNDALGLVWGDWNGHPILWYEGGDWGFSSYFMRFPEQNLSVVVFSNLGSGYAVRYANRVMDVLSDEGWLEE